MRIVPILDFNKGRNNKIVKMQHIRDCMLLELDQAELVTRVDCFTDKVKQ